MKNEFTVMDKKNLCNLKYRADDAARGARVLVDSKLTEELVTAKELKALESCAEFLTEIQERFDKLYNDENAYMA